MHTREISSQFHFQFPCEEEPLQDDVPVFGVSDDDVYEEMRGLLCSAVVPVRVIASQVLSAMSHSSDGIEQLFSSGCVDALIGRCNDPYCGETVSKTLQRISCHPCAIFGLSSISAVLTFIRAIHDSEVHWGNTLGKVIVNTFHPSATSKLDSGDLIACFEAVLNCTMPSMQLSGMMRCSETSKSQSGVSTDRGELLRVGFDVEQVTTHAANPVTALGSSSIEFIVTEDAMPKGMAADRIPPAAAGDDTRGSMCGDVQQQQPLSTTTTTTTTSSRCQYFLHALSNMLHASVVTQRVCVDNPDILRKVLSSVRYSLNLSTTPRMTSLHEERRHKHGHTPPSPTVLTGALGLLRRAIEAMFACCPSDPRDVARGHAFLHRLDFLQQTIDLTVDVCVELFPVIPSLSKLCRQIFLSLCQITSASISPADRKHVAYEDAVLTCTVLALETSFADDSTGARGPSHTIAITRREKVQSEELEEEPYSDRVFEEYERYHSYHVGNPLLAADGKRLTLDSYR